MPLARSAKLRPTSPTLGNTTHRPRRNSRVSPKSCPAKNLVPNEQKRVPVDDASMAEQTCSVALPPQFGERGLLTTRGHRVPPGMNVDRVNQNKDQYTNWDAALAEVVAEDRSHPTGNSCLHHGRRPDGLRQERHHCAGRYRGRKRSGADKGDNLLNLIKQENPNSRILVVGSGGNQPESSVERLTKVSGPKTTNLEGLEHQDHQRHPWQLSPVQPTGHSSRTWSPNCAPLDLLFKMGDERATPLPLDTATASVPAPGWTFNTPP